MYLKLLKCPVRSHHFQKFQISLKCLKISFYIMWPLYQPIRTLEILKYCEISWDFLKKYFHLKSNAVYNSSAKMATKLLLLSPYSKHSFYNIRTTVLQSCLSWNHLMMCRYSFLNILTQSNIFYYFFICFPLFFAFLHFSFCLYARIYQEINPGSVVRYLRVQCHRQGGLICLSELLMVVNNVWCLSINDLIETGKKN